MKMHGFQNKGVTEKAFRKSLKRKERSNVCSAVRSYGTALFWLITTQEFPPKRVVRKLTKVKYNF